MTSGTPYNIVLTHLSLSLSLSLSLTHTNVAKSVHKLHGTYLFIDINIFNSTNKELPEVQTIRRNEESERSNVTTKRR
jgi:hypothetical protein